MLLGVQALLCAGVCGVFAQYTCAIRAAVLELLWLWKLGAVGGQAAD